MSLLDDLLEARQKPVQLHGPKSNKAQKGDSDYGQPGPEDKKHPRGGKGTKEGGRFIKKGDTGSQVATVQKAVGAAVIDGSFQSNTVAAVRAFQKKHGLQVDGIVGEQTMLAIRGRYEQARKATPGAMSRSSGLSVTNTTRAKAEAKHRGVGVAPKRARGGTLLEQAFWDPFLHPRQGGGKFAEKLGPARGVHALSVIPTYDGSKLKFGKSAGGSNGARWAHHKDGSRWLVKTYRGNEDRVATELLSNAIYREMGARVPKAGRLPLHNGKHALTYPTLDGKPIRRVFDRKGPSTEIGKHYMTDALLGNRDVAGLDHDNILWDPSGQPFRVDQGGTLEFRAMGGRKDFTAFPSDVFTMMDPGGQGRESSAVTVAGMRAQAGQIAQTLTPGKIDALVDAAGFRDKKMRERVRRTLKARVKWMEDVSKGPAKPHAVSESFLDRSVKSKDADSVGGTESHKDYNAFLKSHGTGGVDTADSGHAGKVAFGGSWLDPTQAELELHRLAAAKKKAEASDDKYVQRTVSTYKARSSEIAKKLGGLMKGGHQPDAEKVNAQKVKPEREKKVATPGVKGKFPLHVGAKSYVEGEIVDFKSQKDGQVINTGLKITGINNVGVELTKNGQVYIVQPHQLVKKDLGEKPQVVVGQKFKYMGDEAHTPTVYTITAVTAGQVYFTWAKPGGGQGSQAQAQKTVQDNFEKGTWVAHTSVGSAGQSGLNPPSAETGKKLTKPQLTATISNSGVSMNAGEIDLDVGDVIQMKKGGWKYTIKEQNALGGLEAVGPKGATKHFSKYTVIESVKKADGSKVKKKLASETATPAKMTPGEKVKSIDQIKGKMTVGTGSPYKNLEGLPDGAVIETPEGQIGVLRKSEPAYNGYLTAYDLKTGAKFEPHATKYKPHKYSDDPSVMKDAAALLADTNKPKVGDSVKTSGAGGGGATTTFGPPPKFATAAKDSAAQAVFTSAQKKAKLSQAQKVATSSYTGSSATANKAARSTSGKTSLGNAKLIANMDGAMTAELSEHAVIVRKTTHDEWKDAKAGQVIRDNGFFSASWSPNAISEGGVYKDGGAAIELHVLMSPGDNFVFPDALGTGLGGEKEVVLPRGTQFHVLKTETKGGATVLYVETISSD